MSASDYAAWTGKRFDLAEGEAALMTDQCDYTAGEITLAMGDTERTWRVTSVGRDAFVRCYVGTAVASLTLIVPDLAAAVEGFDPALTDAYGARKMQIMALYGFDTGLSDADNADFGRDLSLRLEALPFDAGEGQGWRGILLETRAVGAADYYSSNGSLFFIGIILSAVFLLAAVLIIYYKQVSEGYEDASRFDIMRKVGMTKGEIRRSIASQLLMVFALPLALAGLHLTFAFPMIRRVLTLFGLYNVGLFIRTTLVSFAVFAAFYWIVYRLTSGVYYRIVSGRARGTAET